MTDATGNTWTVTPHGSTFLLTRPGAMRWCSQAEVERGSVAQDREEVKPDPFAGLVYSVERKSWVRA